MQLHVSSALSAIFARSREWDGRLGAFASISRNRVLSSSNHGSYPASSSRAASRGIQAREQEYTWSGRVIQRLMAACRGSVSNTAWRDRTAYGEQPRSTSWDSSPLTRYYKRFERMAFTHSTIRTVSLAVVCTLRELNIRGHRPVMLDSATPTAARSPARRG